VVALGPPPHAPPGPLERGEAVLVDPRLGIHDVVRRMDARPVDGRLRLESLVEDAGGDGHERRP
jgi:hypothetical protein